MAYLIQRYFKNMFRDFRVQDVEFYEDLSDVGPGDVFTGDALAQTTDEVYKAVPAFIEDLIDAGFVIDDKDYLICPACAKIWNLVNGSTLGNAAKMYYVQGDWVDKKTAIQFITGLAKEYSLDIEKARGFPSMTISI